MHEAQVDRCPKLKPELWEKICTGPERVLVALTFKGGVKLEAPFYDGWCPHNFRFEDVIEVEIIGPA